MSLLVLGLNQRTAALELREQLAIPSRDLPASLAALRADPSIDEAVILSTCHRVELYVSTVDPSRASQAIVDFLAGASRLAPELFHARLYSLPGREAAAHLFRVAAGLDSMILGESEITAQVKHAYLVAHAEGATGPVLNRLFQKALHSAKVIRSNTRIAEGQASIGSVVVSRAREVFGQDLTACEALLWGAGKAAEATARHLIKAGIRQLWVVNRTTTKAQELASLCQGGWLSWEQALKHLAHVDIAIVCTEAPHYVIDLADLEVIQPQRGARPLCLIDLAVPRNVEPALAKQPGVHLSNIDDLQRMARLARARREEELARCDALVNEQVGYLLREEAPTPYKEVAPCRTVAA